jgi:hypothetical protein
MPRRAGHLPARLVHFDLPEESRLNILTAVRLVLVLGLLMACAVPSVADAAASWLLPAALPDSGESVFGPELAVAPDGGVLAVWTDARQRMTAALRPAGGSFATQQLSESGSLPSVALDASGHAVAVWIEGSQVQAASWSAGSSDAVRTPLTPVSGANFGSFPKVAFDANGNALAVWSIYDGVDDVVQAAFRPAGGSFGSAQTISAAGQNAWDAQVAFDGQGNALAIWTRSDGANARIEAAFRPVGGSFGAADVISESGQGATEPQLAFDGAGNAIAVWLRSDGTKWRVQAATRPAGGSFGPAETLSEAGESASTPQLAVDPQGDALVAWELHSSVQVASRPAGGSFGAPERISSIDHNAIGPRIAIDRQGNALAVWWDQDATRTVTAVAMRPAGGSFGAPQAISDSGVEQLSPRVAFDDEGNAAATWRRFDGTTHFAEVAAYDAVAPVLRNLVFPASGVAETPLGFGVDAFDVWGPVSTRWDFGDGHAEYGSSFAHVYYTHGSFAAAVTASDNAGHRVDATQRVAITLERVAPVLGALRLSPARFRAAARGTAVAVVTGTTISYALSEPARVRFTVQRATVGRQVGRVCRRATPKRRRHVRCTRWVVTPGGFAHDGQQGLNRLRFTGRLGGRSLARGRYRLIARATDYAHNRSTPTRARFKVLTR